jgi:hypothetical protein
MGQHLCQPHPERLEAPPQLTRRKNLFHVCHAKQLGLWAGCLVEEMLVGQQGPRQGLWEAGRKQLQGDGLGMLHNSRHSYFLTLMLFLHLVLPRRCSKAIASGKRRWGLCGGEHTARHNLCSRPISRQAT